jgi:dolichol-phosphate mannosyltransferase
VKLAVVIGVYDERETIGELTRRLMAVLDGMPGWRWELIYVVEGEDGSRDIALDLARARAEIRVLYQPQRSGLGGAFRRGFAAVPADADFVATMDADLNHLPEEIPRLVEAAVRERADILIGSRFVAGGKSEGTPLWKLALSRALNLWMRGLFGLAARDKTSGFRVYRRPVVESLRYRNDNFAFLPEILVEAHRRALRVREEPIHFVYRRQGRSKMGFWTTAFSYLSLLRRVGDLGGAAGEPRGSPEDSR